MESGHSDLDTVWQIPRSVLLTLLKAGSDLSENAKKLNEAVDDESVLPGVIEAACAATSTALNHYDGIAKQGNCC